MSRVHRQVCASEAQEQESLFEWAEQNAKILPALELMYAIPNGGWRHPVTARALKRQGVQPGVPDVCLPIKRGKYGALFIEMKRRMGGTVSDDQKKWICTLRANGNRVEVCRGWESAVDVIREYLEMKC